MVNICARRLSGTKTMENNNLILIIQNHMMLNEYEKERKKYDT